MKRRHTEGNLVTWQNAFRRQTPAGKGNRKGSAELTHIVAWRASIKSIYSVEKKSTGVFHCRCMAVPGNVSVPRLAVITGTARAAGIGNACAKAFVKAGWSVLGVDKSRLERQEADEEFEKRYHHLVVDISSPTEVRFKAAPHLLCICFHHLPS